MDTISDAGSSSTESHDWRSRLTPNSRKLIVNRITNDLRSLLSLSENEGLNDLRVLVVKFEEKTYTDATSQFDYLRKISLRMIHIENSYKSNPAAYRVNPSDPASLDSTPEKINVKGEDWQEEVYQKIRVMRDLYLTDLNDMHQQLQNVYFLPQQPDNELLEKLEGCKHILESYMQFLQIPKHDILANHKDNMAVYEKRLVDLVNINRQKPAAQQQQPQTPSPPHMHFGGSLQQNALSGPEQVNISPTSRQQNVGGNGTRGSFMESGNWKAQLTADLRQRIVEKITKSLKIHLLNYGFDGILELKKITELFEEGVYTAATSESGYLEILCFKMLDLEIKPQIFRPDAYMPSNFAANCVNPLYPASILPPHMHSSVSLQQNALSGAQQVNINETSLQQIGESGASTGFMESANWKAQLTADLRQSIVDTITASLKIHLQHYGFEGIPELAKISERFEEDVFTAATSQSEYLGILSLKIMDLESEQLHITPAAYMH